MRVDSQVKNYAKPDSSTEGPKADVEKYFAFYNQGLLACSL